MNRFEALAFTLRCLAFETGNDDSKLRSEITGGNIDWPLVVKVASQYYVSPAFCWALSRKGLFDLLPEELRDYFGVIYDLNKERNTLLRQQAIDVCRLLNSVDVAPLILKGAANLLDGVYENPGIRLIGDIDILVQPDELTQCVKTLHEAGYQNQHEARPGRHHYPPLAHNNYVAVVEAHTAVTVLPYSRMLSTDEMLLDSILLKVDDTKIRIPSPSHRTLHNIIHGQLQHGSLDPIYIQQLFDLMLMRNKYEESLDWRAIQDKFERGNYQKAFAVYLEMMNFLFGQTKPKKVMVGSFNTFITKGIFRYQVTYRYVRATALFVDNYRKVLRLNLQSKTARRDLFRRLLKPRFYMEHIKRMIETLRMKAP